LRRRQLAGFRWRRQHVVAGFIVDFYCAELRLAVEVDGEIHATQRAYDAARDRYLGALGTRVLRVSNGDVFSNLFKVTQDILAACLLLATKPRTRLPLSPGIGGKGVGGIGGLAEGRASRRSNGM